MRIMSMCGHGKDGKEETAQRRTRPSARARQNSDALRRHDGAPHGVALAAAHALFSVCLFRLSFPCCVSLGLLGLCPHDEVEVGELVLETLLLLLQPSVLGTEPLRLLLERFPSVCLF